MLLMANSSSAELAGLGDFFVSDSSEAITIAVNYLQSKASNYAMVDIQRINRFETVVGSGTTYGLNFLVRLPLNKPGVYTEIKNKMIWFKNNYTILYGRVTRYWCYDDGFKGKCKPCGSQVLWEK